MVEMTVAVIMAAEMMVEMTVAVIMAAEMMAAATMEAEKMEARTAVERMVMVTEAETEVLMEAEKMAAVKKAVMTAVVTKAVNQDLVVGTAAAMAVKMEAVARLCTLHYTTETPKIRLQSMLVM